MWLPLPLPARPAGSHQARALEESVRQPMERTLGSRIGPSARGWDGSSEFACERLSLVEPVQEGTKC